MTSAAGGVLLVGCGKMGGALLNGWIEAGRAPHSICIVEPDDVAFANTVASLPDGIGHVKSPHDLSGAYRPSVVVLAVKPQIMDEVAPSFRRFAQEGAAILSIAAGRTIDYFQDALGKRAAIVRAMPNTPASIGRGISAAIANAYVTAEHHALCNELLTAVGEVVWVRDEEQMDAVTAVSGSGPAYVFLLAECMAKAGEEAGLPPALAAQLARATVAGAGAMLLVSPEEPGKLRKNVTSPGGTTEAALKVLMAPDGLAPLLVKAVAAAAKRSHELAQ
ncbi:MAG: pyrroline-5-carboxylate reductase [Rhodospirillaceae bacterium]|nr:pyrroline-5-carboxylate reductase [Rhodospirillaceae bacterium]